MERLQDSLTALPFWDELNETQRQNLLRGAVEQSFAKGSLLEGTGEQSGLLRVLKGRVRVFFLSEEGREITLFHLQKGDVCTLGASRMTDQLPISPQMILEEDGRLLMMAAHSMQEVMEENLAVRVFVHELGSQHLAWMVRTMEQILFHHVDQRLASFFLEEYARTGSCEVRMTHEQIAQQISSAREVVARMVKRFTAQGLVEAKRGTIRLLDLPGLEQLNT